MKFTLPSLLLFCFLNLGLSAQNKEDKKLKVEEFPKTISFPSKDGLKITADTYFIDSKLPMIVLCHQASSNRKEYSEIAYKLNKMGFSCLAIDQRSGGFWFNEYNKTFERAKKQNKGTTYVDAEQDILAAIDYAYELSGKAVILWGSSYSAGLALHIASENDKVAGVFAFSPGDYYGDAKPPIADAVKKLKKPMFVTSSKYEIEKTANAIKLDHQSPTQMQFKPDVKGRHGASALWRSTQGHERYWAVLNLYLNKIYKK